MNITCVICADLFVSADSIVAAGGCGHCFHFHCLTQWLERSKTCPQCRSKCTQRNVVRIFLNINTGANDDEDAGQLIHKVDTLTYQVREKDNKLQELKNEIEKAQDELNKEKKNTKSLNKAIEVNESLIYAYKEEMKMLRAQIANSDQLRKEIKELKNKLETLKAVDEVMAATAVEVEEIIKRENDPRILGVLVASLKREMKHGESKKVMLMDSLKNTQSDYRRELEKRKKLEERVSQLESENYRLEQELAKAGNTSTENALKSPEMIPGTPTLSPPRRRLKLLTRANIVENALNSVNDTNNSQSPYLNVKSSSVGLSPLLNKRKDKPDDKPDSNVCLSDKFSIFKKPRLTATNSNVNSNMVFNGLGGSVKKENSNFPIGRSSSMVVKKLSGFTKIPSTTTIEQLFEK